MSESQARTRHHRDTTPQTHNPKKQTIDNKNNNYNNNNTHLQNSMGEKRLTSV